jgi:hypothetical protein
LDSLVTTGVGVTVGIGVGEGVGVLVGERVGVGSLVVVGELVGDTASELFFIRLQPPSITSVNNRVIPVKHLRIFITLSFRICIELMIVPITMGQRAVFDFIHLSELNSSTYDRVRKGKNY